MADLLPAGFYRARGISAELGQTTGKKTEFIQIVFQVVDGDFAGKRVYYTGWCTDKAIDRTLDSLRYCGCTFPDNDITNFDGVDSQDVSIEVEHEQYEKKNEDGTSETKTVAKVKWVNSLARGLRPEAKMSDAGKLDFKSRMLGKVMQAKAKAPVAGDTGGGGGEMGGSEIPF